MSHKRYSPAKIIGMLRETEVLLSQGLTVGDTFQKSTNRIYKLPKRHPPALNRIEKIKLH